ncbi:phosphate ABC transporter permease PstA [Succinatimonas hippei]|uniref:phosphate ABC transporter permease PstA n=1 Tax=Succinatimonas hippei TaxID=626938 RepID=UPI0026F06435|nr:phosphate ABC transporter permease PstA [Succinatimonas hippei]
MQSNLPLRRKAYCGTMNFMMLLCTGITVALTFFLIIYIAVESIPHFSVKILTTKPSYLEDSIGVLPDILNTVYIIITTLVFVLPLGIGAAIYLTEYAKSKKLVGMIEYAIESLAGIPSIIYGLTGMLIFCQFFSLKTSLLSGALTLVIMNLPTIIRTVQESLKTVPQGYREGAFGLGAGKWHMIRTVVLPCCIDGIVTGCILATGRMIGESAALLFTAGFAHALNGFFDALTHSGATLTVALYVYAKEQGEFEVAFVIAAILLVLSFITNMSASYVGRRFQKSKG